MKDRNPLEQQQVEIEKLRDELRVKFGMIFDEKVTLPVRIEGLVREIGSLSANGLQFDKEKSTKQVEEALNIKDKEEFISHLFEALEPLLLLKVTNPKFFAKAQRESILSEEGNIKLGELLYIGAEDLQSDDERLYLHLLPANDFMTKSKIQDFNSQIKNGLVALAKLLQAHPDKKEIWANSWIVALSPKRLEELGFTIVGNMSDEEKLQWMPGENRAVGKSYMMREDFLVRYGSKEQV